MAKAVYNFVKYYLAKRTTPKSIVLDVGCGAQQYKPYIQGTYVGLDKNTSPWAQSKADIEGFLEDVDLHQEKYDLIFGVASFYYMSDPLSNFKKCYDALKPGGRIVLFDYRAETLKKLAKGGDTPQNFWTSKQLKDLIKKGGFVQARDISFISCDDKLLIDDSIDFSMYRLVNLCFRYLYAKVKPGQWLIIEGIK